jgi:hypothetical protein
MPFLTIGVGAATGMPEDLPAPDRLWVLVPAAALLLAAGVVREVRRRRGGGRLSARDGLLLGAGALLGALGIAASVLLAPRGIPPLLWDAALPLLALGLGCLRPLRRGSFWIGCAAGLGASALLLPRLLPANPVLAGAEEPRAGGAAEVAWSLEGARVRIAHPLDPPLEFVNGRRRDLSTAGWPALAEASAAACPDGADEERAALEAFRSGNLDQAVARGRLALMICERPALARAVVGEALLRRAVTALRTGRPRRAAEDLAEAGLLIDDPAARARLERARERLESAAPAPRPAGLPEPSPLPGTE